MLLEQFLSLGEVEAAKGELKQEIMGLSYDSRKIRSGDIFFAVSGETRDGHDFIDEARERGAAAVVVERDMCPASITTIRVKNVRRAMGLWSSHFYGWPSNRMKTVGITGTNGKTTVSYLVESILRAAGLEVGVIGTVNYRHCGREIPSPQTTPESPDLQRLLADMRGAGVNAIAMEVSSHALVQERVRGVNFDVAVFTNLSRDHLDIALDYFQRALEKEPDYALAHVGAAYVWFFRGDCGLLAPDETFPQARAAALKALELVFQGWTKHWQLLLGTVPIRGIVAPALDVVDEGLLAGLHGRKKDGLEPLADARIRVRHQPVRCLHDVRVGVVERAALGVRHDLLSSPFPSRPRRAAVARESAWRTGATSV